MKISKILGGRFTLGEPETDEEWKALLTTCGYEVDQYGKILKDGQPVRCSFCNHWLRVKRTLFLDAKLAVCTVDIMCKLMLQDALAERQLNAIEEEKGMMYQ
jgi:hypothetical protein